MSGGQIGSMLGVNPSGGGGIGTGSPWPNVKPPREGLIGGSGLEATGPPTGAEMAATLAGFQPMVPNQGGASQLSPHSLAGMAQSRQNAIASMLGRGIGPQQPMGPDEYRAKLAARTQAGRPMFPLFNMVNAQFGNSPFGWPGR